MNFTNLSRYSEITECTYRRQFSRSYNFMKGIAQIIEKAVKPTARQIIATDCSFVPKSGKATYGIEHFYNGFARRAEKGLEISVIAIVDVYSKQVYTLSVQQTPSTQPVSRRTRIDCYLEQLEAIKPYLPKSVDHFVNDGFYSKIKWVDGVIAMGRCDWLVA